MVGASYLACSLTVFAVLFVSGCAAFMTYSRDGCRTTVANKYSQEELAFMRTQDSGYLRLKAQTEAKVCSSTLSTAAQTAFTFTSTHSHDCWRF